MPLDAGWSSPVARQAHNLKAAGSNPAPATIFICSAKSSGPPAGAFSFGIPKASGSPRAPRALRPEASVLGHQHDRLDEAADELPRRTCVLRPQGVVQFLDFAAVDLRDVRMQPGAGAAAVFSSRSSSRRRRSSSLSLSCQSCGRLSVSQSVDEPIDLPADALPFAADTVRFAPACACSRFHSAANSSAKTLNRSGSMSRLRSPSITVASSASRRMVRRLPQTVSPLLRAVEQPKCASLILEKPPPQTPQRMSPEKR